MTNQAKVGIFSAITILIFIFGFYFLKGVDLFERQNVYYAVYDRVDGLYKSNLVEINGFPIGRVGKMARNPQTGKIVVELILNNDVQVPESDSTVARLVSTDLLGSKKIKLTFGRSDKFMPEGDTINTFFDLDVSERIAPIISDVSKLTPNLDSSSVGLKILLDPSNPQSIFTTIKGANDAISRINGILASNQESIRLTLINMQSITKNIENNNAAITAIIQNAKGITDSLSEADLKKTVENLNGTIAQLDSVLASVNTGKGTIGKLIKDDELYTHIDSTVSTLNLLLRDIKARPYRYINVSVFGAKKHEERMEKKYNESIPPDAGK